MIYSSNSTKEGRDTEAERPHLEIFIDKTVLRKCMECCQLFLIAKNFKNDEGVYDVCFKIVSDLKCQFAKLHIIWIKNSKYRACTNL